MADNTKLTASDLGWTINADQFNQEIAKYVTPNADGSYSYVTKDGTVGPSFKLASGETWNPSGAANEITFVPKGGKIIDSPGQTSNDREVAGTAEQSHIATEDTWLVGGDTSALDGTPDSNRHVVVEYVKSGDALVPKNPVQHWQWTNGQTNGRAMLVAMAATALTMGAASSLVGSAAGAAGSLGGEGSMGLTAGEIASGAGTGGVELSAAGATVNNPSAWMAGLPEGGAGGAVTPFESGFTGSDFIPRAQVFESAPSVLEPTAITPEVPSVTPQTPAYTNPTGASEIASQNAVTNSVPSYTNPTGASEVASQGTSLTSAPTTPATTTPTSALPNSPMQTIANTPTSTGVELGNSAQNVFRAGEIGAQNAGAGALGMFGTPIMPGSESVAGQLFQAAKTAGTDVASWIKANPSAATMIFSSLMGASNAQAVKEAATIQAQSALDQINQTNANLNANRDKNGAAVAGIRMPGLINSKPLMRSDGTTKVFGANGLINRG